LTKGVGSVRERGTFSRGWRSIIGVTKNQDRVDRQGRVVEI
jgi:hypothetical protein